jgi:hypothetical protein
MVGLGGMAQRGPGGERMALDARRKVVPSGAVVVSMAGLTSLVHGSLF